ncbi:UNKNOWN [Stylonychia lemnae]|uniref:Transmembrane protein n=1 Tax=Stylonychia lemnae TaxID=5949 RepID=A0A078AH29_STYLE|nr:UNKNOWN [Stylonychia lemnae]|eukprot:CDW81544.1 UNKNOWN [Stylonychia lemnae]
MNQRTKLISLAIGVFLLNPSHQKQQNSQFCQFNSDCTSGCCYSQMCQDYNTCSIMDQIKSFENKNYCKLDMDCDGGTTQCCFDQKCVASDVCLQHYYLPLILGLVFSIIIGFIVSKLIDKCLKQQAKRIKKELRQKQRKANRKRQRKEMQQLLGKEGYEQYKQQKKLEKSQRDKDSDDEDEDHQIKVDGQQFILPDESQNPLKRPNNKDDDFDLNAFLEEPKKKPPQQQIPQQQPNPQQQQQPQLSRQQQQQMLQMQIMQQQYQLQQAQKMQQMQQQQQQQQQQPMPFQDKLKPQQVPGSQSAQNRPQNSLNASRLNNGPQFFGKQNPNQGIVQAQNPIYPDYKPNVPNPAKMEQNIIRNPPVNNDMNERRQMIQQNKGALSKHLSQMPKEQ